MNFARSVAAATFTAKQRLVCLRAHNKPESQRRRRRSCHCRCPSASERHLEVPLAAAAVRSHKARTSRRCRLSVLGCFVASSLSRFLRQPQQSPTLGQPLLELPRFGVKHTYITCLRRRQHCS
ncbi:hypothetical protein ACLKA6_015091 [Drosophila palustris]